MARSVFYYHLKRQKAGDRRAREKESIMAIFHEHKGRYGYRRVTSEMRNRGFATNHKVVQRLMGEMRLKSVVRRVRYRSYKGTVGVTAPNVIARDFGAAAPNRKWATDVTRAEPQMGDGRDTDKDRTGEAVPVAHNRHVQRRGRIIQHISNARYGTGLRHARKGVLQVRGA